MSTTLTVNGTECALTLGRVTPVEEGGAYRNGTVTLPDGRTFCVGGGWIHSAASALSDNRCRGLAVDTCPDVHWPGAASEGDFDSYDGYDLGDVDGLADACGLDVDRDTEEGDANWRQLVSDLRDASNAAHA